MIITSVTLDTHQLKGELLPRLRGRVFHVTTLARFQTIQSDRLIKANVDGSLSPTPRYHNAYFRAHGCVSVCDLRAVKDHEVNVALDSYYFLNPESRRASPAFLFLAKAAFAQLIPGSRQLEERDLDKLVVPHVEAGYPDDIPLDLITEALLVSVIHPPPDDYLQALLRAGGPG